MNTRKGISIGFCSLLSRSLTAAPSRGDELNLVCLFPDFGEITERLMLEHGNLTLWKIQGITFTHKLCKEDQAGAGAALPAGRQRGDEDPPAREGLVGMERNGKFNGENHRIWK